MNGRPFGARCSSPSRCLRRCRSAMNSARSLAPVVAADVEPDADDAVGAELVGLLLHARHRELARVVHRLRQDGHLLALVPAATAGSRCGRCEQPTTRPSGSKPASLTSRNSLTERSLVKRLSAAELGDALLPVLRQAFGRVRVVRHQSASSLVWPISRLSTASLPRSLCRAWASTSAASASIH